MNIFSSEHDDKDTHAAVAVPERLRKHEKIAIITSDNVEDVEFFYPYYRFTEEGYTVDVLTPKGGKFAGKHGLGLKNTQPIGGVRPEEYVSLYLPGGKAPAELRKNEHVLTFVKTFARSGKPIAAICHGPQILISANLVSGKKMACWPEVANELQAAGGVFVDEALVEDGQFITARMPGDLPRHLQGVLHCLKSNSYTSQQRVASKSSAA